MSFYIQPIYTKNNTGQRDLYFEGKLKNVRMNDNYNNLLITGNYCIKSNSNLPSYSYFLDVATEFGQVLNVPLHFQQQIEKVNKPSSTSTLYTVDEYSFSFNLNLQQSSYFNEYIKSKVITMNISPMFNQIIVSDFNVQTNTGDLQKFIIDINKSKESYETQYANLIELEPGNYSVWLNKLNIPNTIKLNLEVNDFDPRKIFNEFICFKEMTNKLNLLSTKITLTPLNNSSQPLELTLDDKLYSDGVVSLSINRYITYDANKGTLVSQYLPNITGLFINEDITIEMNATIKFEYMKCVRTISLNQYLNFSNDKISQDLNKLSYTQNMNIQLNEGYSELANEKIF